MRRPFVPALPFLVCACPSTVEQLPHERKPTPVVVDESDPRVVRVGDELYPRGAVTPIPDEGTGGPTPGTGQPDESNGVCRLFAPKLPNPECCGAETGFDVERVREACGHDVYLGESFQQSCGYFFHNAKTGLPVSFRVSFMANLDPKTNAEHHAEELRERLHSDAQAEPVPGVPDAWWVEHKGTHWAFVPGWDRVRQFSWRDDSCSREGVVAVIERLKQAKQPPAGAERPGLVPRART